MTDQRDRVELDEVRDALKSAGISDVEDPAAGVRELAAQRDEGFKLLARCIKYAREDSMSTPGYTRLARALRQAGDLLDGQPPSDKAPAHEPEPRQPKFRPGDRVTLTCSDSPGTGTVAEVDTSDGGIGYRIHHHQLKQRLYFGEVVVIPEPIPEGPAEAEPSALEAQRLRAVIELALRAAQEPSASTIDRKRECERILGEALAAARTPETAELAPTIARAALAAALEAARREVGDLQLMMTNAPARRIYDRMRRVLRDA